MHGVGMEQTLLVNLHAIKVIPKGDTHAHLQCMIKLILMSYFPIILAVNPKFICMDEPTNVLDADNNYTGNDELWAVGSNVT